MTLGYLSDGSIGNSSVGVGSSVSIGGGVPVGAIPKDELFYWTRKWQAGEQESAEARAAGDVKDFATGREAVRWLLSEDGEE